MSRRGDVDLAIGGGGGIQRRIVLECLLPHQTAIVLAQHTQRRRSISVVAHEDQARCRRHRVDEAKCRAGQRSLPFPLVGERPWMERRWYVARVAGIALERLPFAQRDVRRVFDDHFERHVQRPARDLFDASRVPTGLQLHIAHMGALDQAFRHANLDTEVAVVDLRDRRALIEPSVGGLRLQERSAQRRCHHQHRSRLAAEQGPHLQPRRRGHQIGADRGQVPGRTIELVRTVHARRAICLQGLRGLPRHDLTTVANAVAHGHPPHQQCHRQRQQPEPDRLHARFLFGLLTTVTRTVAVPRHNSKDAPPLQSTRLAYPAYQVDKPRQRSHLRPAWRLPLPATRPRMRHKVVHFSAIAISRPVGWLVPSTI